MDIDGFDLVDAAIFGGVVGFVEETIKAEEDFNDEVIQDKIDDYVVSNSDQTLRLLYNQNPGLVRHLIYKAYKSRKQTSRVQKEEVEDIYKEIDDEIAYLKELESKEIV